MKKMPPQITRTQQEISELLKGTRLEPWDPQRDFEENSEGWTADKAVSVEELRKMRGRDKPTSQPATAETLVSTPT